MTAQELEVLRDQFLVTHDSPNLSRNKRDRKWHDFVSSKFASIQADREQKHEENQRQKTEVGFRLREEAERQQRESQERRERHDKERQQAAEELRSKAEEQKRQDETKKREEAELKYKRHELHQKLNSIKFVFDSTDHDIKILRIIYKEWWQECNFADNFRLHEWEQFWKVYISIKKEATKNTKVQQHADSYVVAEAKSKPNTGLAIMRFKEFFGTCYANSGLPSRSRDDYFNIINNNFAKNHSTKLISHEEIVTWTKAQLQEIKWRNMLVEVNANPKIINIDTAVSSRTTALSLLNTQPVVAVLQFKVLQKNLQQSILKEPDFIEHTVKITSEQKDGDFAEVGAVIGGGIGLIFGPFGAIAGAAIGGLLGSNSNATKTVENYETTKVKNTTKTLLQKILIEVNQTLADFE